MPPPPFRVRLRPRVALHPVRACVMRCRERCAGVHGGVRRVMASPRPKVVREVCVSASSLRVCVSAPSQTPSGLAVRCVQCAASRRICALADACLRSLRRLRTYAPKIPCALCVQIFRRFLQVFPLENWGEGKLPYGKIWGCLEFGGMVCIFSHWRSVRRKWPEHPRMADVPQTRASRKARTGQPHWAQAARLGGSLTTENASVR